MNSKLEGADVSESSLMSEEFNINKSNSSSNLDRDEKVADGGEEPFVVIDYREYIHTQLRELLQEKLTQLAAKEVSLNEELRVQTVNTQTLNDKTTKLYDLIYPATAPTSTQ